MKIGFSSKEETFKYIGNRANCRISILIIVFVFLLFCACYIYMGGGSSKSNMAAPVIVRETEKHLATVCIYHIRLECS